jgi:hypothetical protein
MKKLLLCFSIVALFCSCNNSAELPKSLGKAVFSCYVQGATDECDYEYYLIFGTPNSNSVIDSSAIIWHTTPETGIEPVPVKGTYTFDGHLITMRLWNGGGYSGTDSVTGYAAYKNDTIYRSSSVYTRQQ